MARVSSGRSAADGASPAQGSARPASVALGVLCVLALGACALPGSHYHYVHSASAHTYLRLPNSWSLYTKDGVISRLKSGDPADADTINTQYKVFSVFGAASALANEQFLSLSATETPYGQLRVRPLSTSDHESISHSALNSELLSNFDTLTQNGQIKILGGRDLNRPKGYWGRHIVYQLTSQTGGAAVVVDQTALVDTSATVVYMLFVTCSAVCYQQHKGDFTTIVNSWNITQE